MHRIIYRGQRINSNEIVTGHARPNLAGSYIIDTVEGKSWVIVDGTLEQMVCYDRTKKPVFPGDVCHLRLGINEFVKGQVTFYKYPVNFGSYATEIPCYFIGGYPINYDINLDSSDLQLLPIEDNKEIVPIVNTPETKEKITIPAPLKKRVFDL